MNRIKPLRKEKNIKQDVLANLLGLEVAGVSKLETERVPLKDEYIIKLANYFNVSTDYLLGQSNIRNLDEMKNEIYSVNNSETTELLKYYTKLNSFRKRKSLRKC